MDPPAPFRARGHHIEIDLGGARAAFTTRRGGVSAGAFASLNLAQAVGDEPGAVERNRYRLAGDLGLARERLTFSRHVHGTRVRRVRRVPEGGRGSDAVAADGAATAIPGVGVVALAADCPPIAIAGAGAVAVLHCGWRGLAGGIIAEGVRALHELGARGPLSAAIGPGAGPCCYEVGEEVLRRFPGADAAARRGRRLDLKRIARDHLAAAGVGEIHDLALCTICSLPDRLFSHRRDGGETGRQAAVAWLS